MILDSFYTIGKSHKVCQDYIIHGETPVPHVILGDGCSSSPNTDVGARILVHLTSNTLKFSIKLKMDTLPGMIKLWVEAQADSILRDLGLVSQNLDSTLVVLYKDPNFNTIKLMMIGDGIIITKTKDNHPYIVKVSYMGEMPYYLSYSLDKKRNKAYDQAAKELQADGFTKVVSDRYEELLPYCDITVVDYDLNDYEYIIVSSDGLDSFYRQDTGEKIPVEIIVQELCNFKSFKGEFLQRRMKRMLRDYEKQGIYHYDDLSVGIIYNDNNSQ